MNTLTKQTIIFPFGENGLPLHHSANVDECMKSHKKQQGYFFTPEELNEYTADVIRQALDTAAKEAKVTFVDKTLSRTEISVESITNTFEETFQKFKK